MAVKMAMPAAQSSLMTSEDTAGMDVVKERIAELPRLSFNVVAGGTTPAPAPPAQLFGESFVFGRKMDERQTVFLSSDNTSEVVSKVSNVLKCLT